MTYRALATRGLLLGALAGLVWQAPAAWLASVVQTLSHNKMQLRQPQGTGDVPIVQAQARLL